MPRPPAFRILTARRDPTVTIRLEGELDLATAPELRAEADRIAAIEGLARVVLDLRDLRFLDSTGLEVVLHLDRTARERGFELAIVRGQRAVDRLFAVMSLDRQLRMVDDPSELPALPA